MNTTPARGTSGWVLVGRFLAGHHLDKRTTNYTYRYRATRDLTDHGRAGRWAHRAGWERSAYRVSASATTLAILYGMVTDRGVAEDTCMGALAACAVGGAIRARYAHANARHHKRVVRPLWQTITMITESNTVRKDIHAFGDDHKKFISVPRNYADNPNARIRITLPVTWEAQPREVARITQLIQRRLGGQWDSAAHYDAYPQYIDYIPSPAPPASFTLAEALPYIERAKYGELIVGMGTHNRVATINLDSESPHIIASAGTGGGKSVLMASFILQLIKQGVERIDVLDIKRVSLLPFRNIPGIYIHTTIDSMTKAVAEFRKEMENRYTQLENGYTGQFARRVIIAEEMNSMMAFARQYHTDFRNELPSNERNSVPKTSPLISDLGFILFMGRACFMNIIGTSQRFSASAAGSGDMRSQFGAKIMMRYDASSWKMVVGTSPIPKSSRVNGRARLVLGEDNQEIQMILVKESEAIEYAMTHARVDQESALTTVSADGAGSDDVSAMSLREMVDAGLIPVRYSTATRARTRAGQDFPDGRKTPSGIVYRPADVQSWFANRSRN